MKQQTRRVSRSQHCVGRRKPRRQTFLFTASSLPLSTRVLDESSDEEYYYKNEYQQEENESSLPKKPILKSCNSPGSSRRNLDTKKVRFTQYNQILNTEDPYIEEWVLMSSQEVC